ncbi:MAG: DUF4091 domain-containing protein [Clostridia bacterium]|nr:DUF4091 domain-containing protein [Clostridia bacterium]
MNVKMLLLSSLEKVFPNFEPRAFDGRIEGFQNEIASFQVAWKAEDVDFIREYARIRVESPIAAYIRVRRVRYVPVLYPAQADADDNYLSKAPGLFPDPLTDIEHDRVRVWTNHWESAWLDVETDEGVPGGEYPIDVILETEAGETLARCACVYRKIAIELPKQKLLHTKWFHYDALCDSYGTEMFSEKFWEIFENYVRVYRKRTMNVLLTPVHTPPLDTGVGLERRTCQLVDIEKTENGYEFGFDKLERFVRIAKAAGIEYFEIAHLFSQWGAKYAPKIVAKVNGELKRIFGWETEATGGEYLSFLDSYLPALIDELTKLGIIDQCIFHISDEPNRDNLDNYMKAKTAVDKYLDGRIVIDALSDIELYKSGAVKKPVPSNNHIRAFLDENIDGLWTYYCVGQYKDVSNTFISMPSQRTRIIGVQMYKYNIEGFLQWGFNFYNAQFSEYTVNPFMTNDGDGFTPAGDCFQVYPGKDLRPIESIRIMLMDEAVNDMRALDLLESLRGKDFVMNLIEDGVAPIEFDVYPKDGAYLLNLRKKVNREIERAVCEGK